MSEKCILDIETEDLDPKLGRIICIGVRDAETGKDIVFYDENEKQMLKDFLCYFNEKEFLEVIGYNVLFDVRFLFSKCLKYNLSANGFFHSNFNDLMWTMKSVVKRYSWNPPGKLDEWAEFLFGVGKYPLPDSVQKIFENGGISQIIEYNKRDLEITHMLWKRIEKVFSNGE